MFFQTFSFTFCSFFQLSLSFSGSDQRCKHCLYGTIKPGSVGGMEAHLNRDCLGILRMINKIQKDRQNLTDDQVQILRSHFIRQPSREICAYCRKIPDCHRDCSNLIAMFLHLELHHKDIKWNKSRVSKGGPSTMGKGKQKASKPKQGLDSEVMWRTLPSNLPKFKRALSNTPSLEKVTNSSSSSSSSVTSPTKRGACSSGEDDRQVKRPSKVSPSRDSVDTSSQHSKGTSPQHSLELLQKSKGTSPQHSKEILQHSKGTSSQHSKEIILQKSKGTSPQHSKEISQQSKGTSPQHSKDIILQKSKGTSPQHSKETILQQSKATSPQHSEGTSPRHTLSGNSLRIISHRRSKDKSPEVSFLTVNTKLILVFVFDLFQLYWRMYV